MVITGAEIWQVYQKSGMFLTTSLYLMVTFYLNHKNFKNMKRNFKIFNIISTLHSTTVDTSVLMWQCYPLLHGVSPPWQYHINIAWQCYIIKLLISNVSNILLIAYIAYQIHHIFPFLIIVPKLLKSLGAIIANWVILGVMGGLGDGVLNNNI